MIVLKRITYAAGCILLSLSPSLNASQNNQTADKIVDEGNMTYTHTVQPAIQVLSRNAHSISFINGFQLNNSNAQYFSYQKTLDDYLLKGKNTLEVYIKPSATENNDDSHVLLLLNTFGEHDGASGRSHYESHDSETDMYAKDVLPSDLSNGKPIVRLDFRYNHQTGKETVDSSISENRFDITSDGGKLFKSSNPDGKYLFNSLHVTQNDEGYYKIEIAFYLDEDRPYTAIYTADDIPTVRSDDNNAIFALPDATITQGLYEETHKAYEILKAQDFDAWYEYIKPVTTRFRSNPVFEGIYPPGMSADVAIEAAINQMSCILEAFPEIGDESVVPTVLFQNKLAVIKDAIYYSSTKFRYSMSIDIYYAYENNHWVVSYIEVD